MIYDKAINLYAKRRGDQRESTSHYESRGRLKTSLFISCSLARQKFELEIEKDKAGPDNWIIITNSRAELLWQWQCCCTASSYSCHRYTSFVNVRGNFPPHMCHMRLAGEARGLRCPGLYWREEQICVIKICDLQFSLFHGNSLGAAGKGPEFFLLFCASGRYIRVLRRYLISTQNF